MVPNGIHILSMNYNHKLRLTRKLMSPLVNTSVVERAFPVQNAASTKLLRKLSETPENYHTLIQRFNGEVILATVYGLQDTGHNAQLLTRMFDTQERWSAIIEPGATPPIEVFPILKYAPEVVSPWKREAKWIRNSQQSIYGALMEATQQRIRDGKYLGCLMDDLLHEKNPQIGGQDLLHLGGTLLEAGLDTQSAMLQTFLMAMAAYPDIALQAQVEVDAVCGASRLPDFQDLEKFPFIKACVEETFRWRPVAPMGIPHALDRDDTHKSFFFPAGTTFVMNVWAMHMDPNEYDDPESFKPSRFLRNKFGTKYDPTASESAARRNHYGFGAGRRVCPGQRMGELNLYLTAAKLVWLFDMRYVGDGELDTSLTTGFKAGITVAPKEFPLELRIRSEERRAAMVKDLEKAEALLSTYYAK
ncbi:MAG: hypothetical protein M1820_001174 [Bogoriella megaspora]|nr:MAG: hypothetical protein M1820_001174 [Bogoriella megaspora]